LGDSTLVHIEQVPHDDIAVVRREIGGRTRRHVLRHLHQYPELGASLAGEAAFGDQLLEVDAVSDFADLIVVGDERLRECRHHSTETQTWFRHSKPMSWSACGVGEPIVPS